MKSTLYSRSGLKTKATGHGRTRGGSFGSGEAYPATSRGAHAYCILSHAACLYIMNTPPFSKYSLKRSKSIINQGDMSIKIQLIEWIDNFQSADIPSSLQIL